MKKVLTNIILLFTFSISGMAQIEYGKTVEISKDNIIELLQQRNASEISISQFMELMNDCEFARYAPATDTAMHNDFDRAISIISELEKQLK